ncbi:MAG TPA: CGNR zinc finger domain-containing protein [Streptosporangiaceae bacterium]|nr:CGNR zinc finger domain-containing protein [Streptosporangiaceae bacterium]
MNLASFAELAVRLVNSRVCSPDADPLRSQEAFRDFVADRPYLAVQVTRHDLDRLRLLREELAGVFVFAAGGASMEAAQRLNALLAIHPVHPVLVAHDGEPLHVHLSESGSVTDRYACAAVISLALLLSQFGADHLGICAIAACDQVFIDGSSNRSRRYCADHSAARSNVAAMRQRRYDFADPGEGNASAVS